LRGGAVREGDRVAVEAVRAMQTTVPSAGPAPPSTAGPGGGKMCYGIIPTAVSTGAGGEVTAPTCTFPRNAHRPQGPGSHRSYHRSVVQSASVPAFAGGVTLPGTTIGSRSGHPRPRPAEGSPAAIAAKLAGRVRLSHHHRTQPATAQTRPRAEPWGADVAIDVEKEDLVPSRANELTQRWS